MQLVVMTLQPGEEIGLEVHDENDQFIHLVSGRATVTMGPSVDEVTEAHDAESGWASWCPRARGTT
jgi:mannose-6-phosphate isomerase-like protein (cupin superfamily)